MGKITTRLALLVVLLAGCGVKPARDPITMDHIEKTMKLAVESHIEKAIAPTAEANDNISDLMMSSSQDKTKVEKNAEPRFDIEVADVPTSAFLMGLVKDTPYSMLVPPSVLGTVTLSMQDVTVKEVLASLNTMYGIEFKETTNGFEILSMTMQSRVYRLDYLFMTRTGKSSLGISGASSDSGSSSADVSTDFKQDIWGEIKAIVQTIIGEGDGRSIAVSPQSGIIIVKAMPAELKKVDEFLQKVQRSLNRQVILEAKIIEVQLTDGYQAGINWGSVMGKLQMAQVGGATSVGGTKLGTKAGAAMVTNPNTAVQPLDLDGTATSANWNGATAFGGIFSMALSNANFSTFVEALSAQGNVQVLSAPRVSTLNNQKAIIKVGQDGYYVTSVSSSTQAGSGGGLPTTSQNIGLGQFFSGIALDVTPFIDQDDSITLHVHPSITEVSEQNKTVVLNGQNQVLPLANSAIRESDTIIRARDGQLVIIGGLMQTQTTEAVASIPFLGKIPVIGALFRQTKQDKIKSELVILLKPAIVDQDKWGESMREEQDRLESVNRGFHSGGRSELFGSIGETQENP